MLDAAVRPPQVRVSRVGLVAVALATATFIGASMLLYYAGADVVWYRRLEPYTPIVVALWLASGVGALVAAWSLVRRRWPGNSPPPLPYLILTLYAVALPAAVVVTVSFISSIFPPRNPFQPTPSVSLDPLFIFLLVFVASAMVSLLQIFVSILDRMNDALWSKRNVGASPARGDEANSG